MECCFPPTGCMYEAYVRAGRILAFRFRQSPCLRNLNCFVEVCRVRTYVSLRQLGVTTNDTRIAPRSTYQISLSFVCKDAATSTGDRSFFRLKVSFDASRSLLALTYYFQCRWAVSQSRGQTAVLYHKITSLSERQRGVSSYNMAYLDTAFFFCPSGASVVVV